MPWKDEEPVCCLCLVDLADRESWHEDPGNKTGIFWNFIGSIYRYPID